MMMYGCLIVPSSSLVYVITPTFKTNHIPLPSSRIDIRPLSTFRRSFIHSSTHTKGRPPCYPPRDQPGERTKTSASLSNRRVLSTFPHYSEKQAAVAYIYIRVLIPTSPCKHLVPQTLPTVVDFHHTKLTEDVTSRLYNPISSIKENRGNLRRRPSLHHHLRHYSKRTRRCRVAR